MSARPGEGLDAALRHARTLAGTSVTAGIQQADGASPKEVRGPDGQPVPGSETLLDVAARNHYGEGVPARPWLATAFERYRQSWARRAKTAAERWMKNQDVSGFSALGVTMVANCKQTLLDGPWQPNSAATVAAKGSSQPLVDTSQLVGSHRAEVRVPGADRGYLVG